VVSNQLVVGRPDLVDPPEGARGDVKGICRLELSPFRPTTLTQLARKVEHGGAYVKNNKTIASEEIVVDRLGIPVVFVDEYFCTEYIARDDQ